MIQLQCNWAICFNKSTWGIDTKLVPVIVIVVAVDGAIVWDTSATVGLTTMHLPKLIGL